MLLDRGICGDRRYLSRATCGLFMGMKAKSSRRGLGFDKPDIESDDNSPCAPEAPASVLGILGLPELVSGLIRIMNWCLSFE